LSAVKRKAGDISLPVDILGSLSPFGRELVSSIRSPSWLEALADDMRRLYFTRLLQFLEAEAGKLTPRTFYPPPELVFNAFNLVPLDEVRVVILGQDPYINPNQAMGLCFSVPIGCAVPPSLANIYKELETDIDGFRRPTHGDLTHWARQGVLLLNTVLTVRPGTSNSHAKQGWETFTDRVIELVCAQPRSVVWLLWGKPAEAKVKFINQQKHHVLKAPHPSPLSAHRGFFGSRPFSSCNALLARAGLPPVDWKLPSEEEIVRRQVENKETFT